jgi:outer membrane protein insertion porin family
MQRKFKFFIVQLFLTINFIGSVSAQNTDTIPSKPDPVLEAINNSLRPIEYTIAGVTVTGTSRYDAQLLMSISGLHVGSEILLPGSDIISKAIINLWNQRLFSNVEIYYTKLEGKNLYLEISVTERPALSKYVLRGVKKTDEDELKPKMGLRIGGVVTENVIMTSTDAIRGYFSEKGYQNVKINVDEAPDPALPNTVILYYNVNKGSKVKVEDVSFYGNEEVSELKLKKRLKGTKELSRLTLYPENDTSYFGVSTKPSFKEFVKDYGFLSPTKIKDFLDPYFRFKLFSSAKFNDKKFEEDKESVIRYYNSIGYRDANIIKDTQYFNNKGRMEIEILVSEGNRYYFGDIAWKGNTKFNDSLLTALLGIKKGDIYNIETLYRKLGKELTPEGGDISGYYMDDGYLFFQVDPVETAVYNDTIDFEIRIIEGPQATIKNINIAGNEKTKDHVVRRELRTIPGEKFSRTDLIRTQRELSQLGYFNQEKIGMNPIPDQESGTVDINFTLEEKSSDQLELSAGWGGGIGLTGTLGVTFNNFSIKNLFKKGYWDRLPTGDGQKLSLRLQSNGRAYQSYNVSFTEPWLGGKRRNQFTISAYKSLFRTGGLDQNYRYYFSDTNKLSNFGVVVSLGKQLRWPDDFFTLVYSLNFTQYKLQNYPYFTQAFTDGTSNNLSMKLALNRNSAGPNPMFPTSGSNFMASVQFTPPYSLFNKGISDADNFKLPEFHKWRVNAEWFLPIGRPHGEDRSKQFVIRAAAKYGFMGRYNKNLDYSPFERFQVGDAGLANGNWVMGYDIIAHRGYPVYETSDPKVNPDQSNARQFFTIFNKYSLELRYPFSTNPNSTIFGMVWFEAANGWYDYKSYNPFKLRRSAGVGMRFFLPMFGLLGFDYGVGFDRLTPGNGIKNATRFTFMLGFEPE